MYDVISSLLIFLISIILSIFGSLYIRKRFGHEHLSKHNEVAGFIYAVIGVIYAVLIAFVVVFVWENHKEAHSIVEEESILITDIQALDNLLDERFSIKIDSAVERYLKSTLEIDWKLMEMVGSKKLLKNKPSDIAFSELRALVYSYLPSNNKEELIFDRLTEKIDKLSETRNLRFLSAKMSVPNLMWFVIIIGGFFVLLFSMFFSSANLWSQLIMISILSASISLVIILIYAMDHPFSGLISVQPDSLINLINKK